MLDRLLPYRPGAKIMEVHAPLPTRRREDLEHLTYVIDRRISDMQLLATRAGVEPAQLRTLLIRLRNNPAHIWEAGSAEERAQQAIVDQGLPPVATLVRAWSRYLELTDIEVQALREGIREGVVLALLSMPLGQAREDLLRQARAQGWLVEQMRQAVRELPNPPQEERSIKK
ncbi:hypothetical protein ACI3L1_18605 [Deinococcus sp. SM5_A1]|uniref:hypothetical protein n=1 Tax=Deinococcus sp. SM5_A1 TaxID=3379094 RepID=UPI00385E100B